MSLDLSSFPLLRIDEIPQHDADTLQRCEEALAILVSGKGDENDSVDPFTAFADRLLELIRIELADRRVRELLEKQANVPCDFDRCADPVTLNTAVCRMNSPRIDSSDVTERNENAKGQHSATGGYVGDCPNIVDESSLPSPSSSVPMPRFPRYFKRDSKEQEDHPRGCSRKTPPIASTASAGADPVHGTGLGRSGRGIRRGAPARKTSVWSPPHLRGGTATCSWKNKVRSGKIRTATPSAAVASFVVSGGPRTNGYGEGDGLRARARSAAKALKIRSQEGTEEYHAKRREWLREERRLRATERMEKRRAAQEAAVGKRRVRREAAAKRREEAECALREEMKRAAEGARIDAMKAGKSEGEAIAEAAAAATAAEDAVAANGEDLVRENLSDTSSESLSDAPDDLSGISVASENDSSFCSTEVTVLEETEERETVPVCSEKGNVSICDTAAETIDTFDDSAEMSRCGVIPVIFHESAIETAGARSLALSSEDSIHSSPAHEDVQSEAVGLDISTPLEPDTKQKKWPSQEAVTDTVISGPESSGSDSEESIAWAPFSHTEESLGNIGAKTKTEESAQREQTILSPLSARIVRADSYSFVERFPHFGYIFTLFSKTATGIHGKRVPAGASANELRDLLRHRCKLNSVFMQVMKDFDAVYGGDMAGHCLCEGPSDLIFRISSSRTEVSGIVSDVLCSLDDANADTWRLQPEGYGLGASWNLLWTWAQPKLEIDSLLAFQKINRFRKSKGLTRKDLLKKNIQRLCASSGGRRDSVTRNAFSIMPLTFVLPQEYNAFVAAFTSIGKISGNTTSNFWIMKPVGLSRGRGISVVNDIGAVSYSEPVVIQKYLTNPLLFLGYKFDLRLYVLVTSFNPLEAFIYQEAFARFSSRKYSANPDSIDDRRIHLTNSSIQSEFWDDMDRAHPARLAGCDGGGNKVRLSWLWKRFGAQGVDTSLLWRKVMDLCIKTLVSAERDIPFQPNSFEVYGFDCIFDDQLNVWLVEVNACPSLGRETELDIAVKEEMIRDVVALVDPPKFDRKALAKVCKQRLSNYPKGQLNSCGPEKQQLEQDLREILMDRLPRRYGEMPENMGNFKRIAPGSNCYNKLLKRFVHDKNSTS